ncbi:ATP-grasp domain-containing protein [Actinokineospora diospyrosa]|uniref:ATP-grasp domain-containing protein n=1 Tax=Actinokineospora diospyrosa TaxID=103728 RepID=A0ABT1IF10_9PSEU|nr:ATP-grasp domain-containing protein [Actinokineospora diospyrosa]MCP2271158.1 ATP-grasp domain-containing protein [Actinokineospora diospyrosa]
MKVLVINSHPYGELFFQGGCRVPAEPRDRMLVSSDYNNGLSDHDAADFPAVAKCADIYDEEHVRKAVYELAADGRPDRIVTISEQLMLVAAELREELGLAGQDVDSTLRFRDKVVMKRVLRDAGCSGIPRFVEADHDLTELPWEAEKYVVKARLGFGSRTVRIVSDLDGLNRARRELAEADPAGVEVEEFVVGEMYHCDGVVHNGEAVFGSVSRYVAPPGEFRSVVSHGSITLQDCDLSRRISAYHAEVVRHLGMRDGVTHLEVFVTPDGEIVFCEIAARPGGGGICYIVRQAHGVDLISAALRAQSGVDPITPAPSDGLGRVWGLIGFYPKPDLVPAPFDAASLPPELGVHLCVSSKRSGNVAHSTDYVHKFFLSASDADEFDRKHEALCAIVAERGWDPA